MLSDATDWPGSTPISPWPKRCGLARRASCRRDRIRRSFDLRDVTWPSLGTQLIHTLALQLVGRDVVLGDRLVGHVMGEVGELPLRGVDRGGQREGTFDLSGLDAGGVLPPVLDERQPGRARPSDDVDVLAGMEALLFEGADDAGAQVVDEGHDDVDPLALGPGDELRSLLVACRRVESGVDR